MQFVASDDVKVRAESQRDLYAQMNITGNGGADSASGENHLVIAEYIGKQGRSDIEGPQVFRVDMDNPNGIIRAHFHDVDQFQVVWRGSGRLGREELSVGAVHYVDSHVSYGPLVGGNEGIGFFTIRAMHTGSAFFMPGSEKYRSRQKRRPGVLHQLDLANPRSTVLVGPYDDGVSIARKTFIPHDQIVMNAPVEYGPHILLVLGGELLRRGSRFGVWSVIALAPGDITSETHAGAAGVDLLVLQFAQQLSRPPDR